MRVGSVVVTALLLAGCSSSKDKPSELASAGSAAVEPPSFAPEPAEAAAAAAPAAYQFAYRYPDAVRAIPALRLILGGEAKAIRARLVSEAEQARSDAQGSGFPFRAYSYSKTWQVVSKPPGWLSLSARIFTDTGGAHPMAYFDALVWDERAGKRHNAVDLFRSSAALSQAIRAAFCDALDRQRAAKRGKPVKRGSTDMFDKCIDPTAETLILGSVGGKAFDRVGVLVAPYDAGPYVEGSYEVTLPVTPAVIAAVRPEYRRYFAAAR